MDTHANAELLRTAALKRADANFETAPRAGLVIVGTWLAVAIVLSVVVMNLIFFLMFPLPRLPQIGLIISTVLIVVIVIAGWFCSRISNLALSGQMLSIKMTFWTATYDLAGLRSVGVDAKALKGTLRTFGNGGLGAFHGYFYSKRMGKFRAYVTDTSRSVVLRWENKCVVVSPKDTEYFIEEVCKRTGACRQN